MSVGNSGCPFTVGQAIEFEYPVDNRFKVSIRLSPRKLIIRGIRDLAVNPLSLRAFRHRPDVRRSRFLLSGTDLSKKSWRCFYFGAMEHPLVIIEQMFQFALFDPIRPLVKPIAFGSLFTDKERRSPELVDLLKYWNKQLAKSKETRIVGVRLWNTSA